MINTPGWPDTACTECITLLGDLNRLKSTILESQDKLEVTFEKFKQNKDSLSETVANIKTECELDPPVDNEEREEEAPPEDDNSIVSIIINPSDQYNSSSSNDEDNNQPKTSSSKSIPKSRRLRCQSEEATLENVMQTMDLLKCHECQTATKSLKELFSHFKTAHDNPRGYIFCCDRKKIGRVIAFDHMRVHLKEDAFKCADCGQRYPTQWSLDYHQKQVHTAPEDRDYMCDVCGKTFANKPGFDDHVKYHTAPEDRPHKCPICGKGFTTPYQVKRHVARLHDKSEAFICEQCGRGFGSPSLLSTHIYKVHRDRKVDPLRKGCKYIRCSKCSRRVSERNYQAHVANNCFVEGGGASMVCIVCGRKLKTAKSLKAHMRLIHPDRENGQTCPHCKFKPATSGNRMRHIRNAHPKEFEKMKYTIRDDNDDEPEGL